MAIGQYGGVVRQVHRLFGRGTAAGLSEWQLLRRYVTGRDEAAFEALVARHGPMVLGVCRRLLDDPHAVDDAFQATFLVLVRKAGALGERDVLGHWLYGVACRVALRARAEAARRRARERPGGEDAAMERPHVAGDDLRGVLDEELRRLPEKYRRPVVLCYLEGATHEEAARQLGWPLGTVKGRLARARDLLRGRLTRRGLPLSGPALVAALSRDAKAAVPAALLESTVGAALRVAAGLSAAGAVSASVAALTEGVLKAMTLEKLGLAAAALISLGVATGAGALAYQESGPAAPAGRAADVSRSTPTPPGEGTVDQAVEGPVAPAPGPMMSPDSTPSVADLAEERLEAARKFLDRARADYEAGRITTDRYCAMSRRVLEAQLDLNERPTDRIAAYQAHLDRTMEIEGRAQFESQVGRGAPTDVAEAEYNRIEAELWLARAKAKAGQGDARPGPGRDDRPSGGDLMSQALKRRPRHESADLSDDDEKTKSILQKLDQPIPIQFPDETPLEDALKYVKAATQGENDSGIPIYVDPVGLQEAEKTMQSPIQLDLEGVPLKTTLRLMLAQLGLIYEVREGLIKITADGSEDRYTPLTRMEEMAEKGELTLEELEYLLAQLKALKEIERVRRGDPQGTGGMGGGGFR